MNDLKITNAWDDNKNIYLYYREEDKKKIKTISDFDWYFCILEKDWLRFKEIAKKYDIVKKAKKYKEYIKVYCTKNYSFMKFSEELEKANIQTFEKDLTLTKRYIVDNDVEFAENMKILYFDIETDDSNFGIEVGRDQILSWAAIDNDNKLYYYSSKNEKELLLKLINLFNNYDLISGWNSYNFDLPYIKIRMEKNNVVVSDTYWKRLIHIDLMQRYIKLFANIMSILGLKNFSLEEVGQVFVKRGKVKREEKIKELFDNNPEKLKEYNTGDVKLLKDIDNNTKTLPMMIKEAAMTRTLMNNFFVGELLDTYILRFHHKENIYLQSRPSFNEVIRREDIHIIGGFVKEPEVGYYEDVKVFDFKSLYPSIIINWNIGEESLIKEVSSIAEKHYNLFLNDRKIEDIPFEELYDFLIKEKTLLDPVDRYYQSCFNQFFRKDKVSIVSKLVEELLVQREFYKKEMLKYEEGTTEFANARATQEVVKELANSMFGITADKNARYFNPYICQSITLTGQFLNRFSTSIFEELGYRVIYGDTDSVFVVIKENLSEVEKKINLLLNKRIKEMFRTEKPDNFFQLRFDKSYKKFILMDKKKYVGFIDSSEGKKTGFIHTRGLEIIKKDTIEFTRRKMYELINLIFKDKDLEEVIMWLINLKEFVKTQEIPKEDLAISKKLAKPITDYKSRPIYVKIAEKLLKSKKILDIKKNGKYTYGAIIRYIVEDEKEKEACTIEDFSGKWDRDFYWETPIYAPIYRILKIVFPEQDWDQYSEVKNKRRIKKLKQQTLDI